LSDIDGLYDAPPGANPNAKLIPIVESVSSEIEAMAGAAESELSRGGMYTKIEAAKIATNAGTHMLIASGKIEHPLPALGDGAQTLDRGLAGAEGHADDRCGRRQRPARRQKPAAGWRDPG